MSRLAVTGGMMSLASASWTRISKVLVAPGLVGGELEAEDGEELLVRHGDGLGVDGVDAYADGRELVGGISVVAEESVFDVHGVVSGVMAPFNGHG